MEEIAQFKTIEDYYKFIDSKIFNSIELGSVIEEVKAGILNLKKDEQDKISLEINCLNIPFRNGSFPKHLLDNILDNFDTSYIENRIENLKNEYLKAHFSHILWYKFKNKKYFPIAIDSYFKLVHIFKQLDVEKPQAHYGIEICHILDNLENLTYSTKTRTDDFIKLVLDLIHNPNEESSCFNKLTLDCLRILIGKNKKLDKKIFNGLEKICEDVVQNDLNFNFMTAYFKAALDISRITNTDTNKWILKEAEYFENLSESNNGNIMAPQYCQKAIELYKELKMDNKVNELYKKYSFLSKNIKLSFIKSKEIDLTPFILEYEKFVEEHNSNDILKFIAYSFEVLPNYQSVKDSAEKILANDPMSLICSTFIIDEYGNKIKNCDTDEKNLQRIIDNQYDFLFDFQVKMFLALLKKSFELKKINSEIIIDYIKHTWLGMEQTKQLSTGELYKYSWLDYIEESILSSINKMKKFFFDTKDKKYIFVQEIDCISSKIEGILRDIGIYSNLEEFRAFKFDKDKNFEWNNINKYLCDSSLTDIIDKNELQFFRYFLIDRRNLRNRVAHCMMFKSEYGIQNIIMLLFVILRLSKYLQLKE